jgi:hypothetical protein
MRHDATGVLIVFVGVFAYKKKVFFYRIYRLNLCFVEVFNGCED